MIWCMLDPNRAQSKGGYTISRFDLGFNGYSYLVTRPSGSKVVWVGAEVPGGRKVAVRACLDDMKTL